MHIEVVKFPSTGHTAVYVGGLQVGKVYTRADGRLYVKNETPAYKGYSFADDRAIIVFTRCMLLSYVVPTGMGIAYDHPLSDDNEGGIEFGY